MTSPRFLSFENELIGALNWDSLGKEIELRKHEVVFTIFEKFSYQTACMKSKLKCVQFFYSRSTLNTVGLKDFYSTHLKKIIK